ncbi:peptidylprolyl isomerase [Novosphingobium sp. 1949]|uniref:peptidylprolyl isomerase n=1 Tax=Novosphingobium organovorum TaxID=2930092 RepID=A0ABT0BG79_9SPHN|nr:peptidylprolyl isomerase [Novosphingobium organovorum]MCJ2184040.1 peptidylprolyl isomerase [Novosphingobium organovorum]
MQIFLKGALPLLVAATALTFPALACAQTKAAQAAVTPNGVIEAAKPAEWRRIDPKDLMVIDLAPDAKGHPRRVVIQLMPAPFAQGWVDNMRKLIAARWYDGIAVVRVQDNYVVQWGDPNSPGEAADTNGDTAKEKTLPKGLAVVPQSAYTSPASALPKDDSAGSDAYAPRNGFVDGWPIAGDDTASWPIHCYGAVGVGRDMSPDTGTGAELYTVIGQAPRQLDRNIAVVGRVIEGMGALSALPRGPGAMGFYTREEDRTPIVSVRLGSAIKDLPGYEYLSTTSDSFAAYVHARANRKDGFYNVPAGGVDICNVPVPIRQVAR